MSIAFAVFQWLFLAAAIITAYCIWIRPILHERPELKALYARTDSYYEAFMLRFRGIKARLVAGIGMAGSALYILWDLLVPYLGHLLNQIEPIAGMVDWTPIKVKMPDWVWPLIMFGMFWLINYFRKLTDRRQEEEEHERG
jgi:hypothetical protein